MPFSRRDFLKLSGGGLCTFLASGVFLPKRGSKEILTPAKAQMAMLFDVSKCVGCRTCQMACKRWNNLPPESTDPWGIYESPRDLSARTWTLLQLSEVEEGSKPHWAFLKRQCMHCLHPACVSACPVGALRKMEDGPVVYDAKRCIGCRYCMIACPFGVPRFEWEKPLPLIQKCTFCVDRLAEGLSPACADACYPIGANIFGERNSLIAEAESRIRNNPGNYVNHIYGKEEVGGTSVLYISPIPFEKLGLPTLSMEPITDLSEKVVVYGTPSIAVGVAALLSGIYWFTKRKERVQAEEAASQAKKEL